MNIKTIEGGFRVPLSAGQWTPREPLGYCLIDENQKEKVLIYKWSLSNQGYAYRTFRKDGVTKHEKMHRFLISAPEGMCVDHINRDRLDNRLCNLRLCERRKNSYNATKRKNTTSRYKGVYWKADRGYWVARVKVDGKNKILGHFSDETEAAKAYNEGAALHYGEFCSLNPI